MFYRIPLITQMFRSWSIWTWLYVKHCGCTLLDSGEGGLLDACFSSFRAVLMIIPHQKPRLYKFKVSKSWSTKVFLWHFVPSRFARDIDQDCVVNGHLLPKGATLEIPAGFLHYDPEHWPEPEKFIPERSLLHHAAANDIINISHS